MNADAHTGESLSYRDLNALRECKEKYAYGRLSLHRKGYERRKFISDAFRRVADASRAGRPATEVCSMIERDFKAGYLKEWFDFGIQHGKSMEKDIALLSRLARYLSGGFAVRDVDVAGTADVSFPYKGIPVGKISVKADAVLEKEGRAYVVLFDEGENPFSVKARKPWNRPSHSIALCCAYLAFEPAYGPDVRVETWYLKGKDDRAGCMAEEFEGRPGSNIAGHSFSGREDAMACLKEALLAVEERNCSSCGHRDVCHFPGEVNTGQEAMRAGAAGRMKAGPRFTPAQEEVVNFMDGAMCCIAVPGAGKTFALAGRLANLLRAGVPPSEILFVTFTKKAAGELRDRAMALMDTTDGNEIPAIYTFNAFGYSVLRENPILVGRRVKIADTLDRLMLIKQALSNCPAIQGVSYDGAYLEYGLIRRLDGFFEDIRAGGEEGFIARHGEKKDVRGIMAVYKEYERLFYAAGFISFDMQISMVNELFRKYPALAERYAEKYRYVMVDEYQDTNEEQAAMIYAIAKRHGNIMVVGDDDQSIYAWRGASSRFMLGFRDDFPSAKMVFMNDNFRSNSGILNPAKELISRNAGRFRKDMVGHKEAKHRPVYWKQACAGDMVKIITNAMQNGYRPGDIAVLGRTNRRLADVMAALDGIVKTASPKDYLREDTVFLVLYDALALYYSGLGEDVSLYRWLSFFGAACGPKTDRGKSLYQDLTGAGLLPEIDRARAGALGELRALRQESAFHMAAYRLVQVFQCIRHSHGLREALHGICRILFGLDSHPVMERLIEKADEKAAVKLEDVYTMMGNILLFSDDSRVGYGPREDAVNLLTAHDSKGKEFPLVIIYAMEDFKDEPDEHRLLYVAMTRAKDTLFMLESAYSTCELLPYFASGVSVRQKGVHQC